MRPILSALFVLLCLGASFGQAVELFSSAGTSHHFSLKGDQKDSRNQAIYGWRNAYSFGAAYSYLHVGKDRLKIALRLNHVNGYYSMTGGSLAGSYNSEASFSKTNLSVAAYVASRSQEKTVQLQFGIAIDVLLESSLKGRSAGSVGGHVWDTELNFEPLYFAIGLEGGIRTKLLKLGKHTLLLLGDVYLGVLDDIDMDRPTHSVRLSTGLSLLLGGSASPTPSPASS